MNSSGIKRGLATTAVSALAVAGIPFIASSASAATGDSIEVASVGPVRNAGTQGGVVVLKTKGVDEDNIRLSATDLTSRADSPSQTVEIVGSEIALSGTANDTNKTDGLDEITLNVRVSTPAAGGNFAFAVYEDEDNDTADSDPGTPGIQLDGVSDLPLTGAQAPDVDATEARANVTGSTAGAPTSIAISPETQTTSAGVPTGDYTATIRDASNNLTQLTAGETFVLAGTGVTFTPDGTLTPAELQSGSTTFKASSNTAGSTTFTATGAGGVPATVNDSAAINVIANADITADEFDLVTGADEYETGDAFGGTYEVRVDQGSVTLNFASKDGADLDTAPDDANKAVVLTVTGNGVTFGGQASRTYTIVLDANGQGSLTLNPEGIQAGDFFTFASPSSNIASTTVDFTRAAAASVEAGQDVYVTKVGESTSVTVTVLDQFGDPIGAPAQVQLVRAGNGGRTANDGATARVTVGADGTATFNLPDAGTTAGTEDLDVRLYDDQFDGIPVTTNDLARIKYTADGLGGDFALNDITPGSIVPLTDGVAGGANESKVLTITGGTPNAPATVTVDNGALILGANNNLSSGAASRTVTLDGNGDGSVEIVGTSTGTVTATVASSGRTKTETLTVAQVTGQALLDTARNIELEGPENVVAGDVATYTATVTDAFGNPVAGYDDGDVVFQVSGPGSLQNKEAATDGNGEIEQTVLLTDNANGSITVSVRGEDAQFGAAANELTDANPATAAPGLSASEDTDSVTSEITNLEELEQAVADAEAELAAAEADLAEAQAELDVAQAQLAIATAEVDRLRERKADLRQKLNKAKRNDNKQKAKTTRKKLRQAKRDLRDARQAVVVAQAAVDGEQNVVDLRQQAVTEAEEALAAAQAELDEAQN